MKTLPRAIKLFTIDVLEWSKYQPLFLFLSFTSPPPPITIVTKIVVSGLQATASNRRERCHFHIAHINVKCKGKGKFFPLQA
jgi:hypothetical protein